jgi:hypothetical protein
LPLGIPVAARGEGALRPVRLMTKPVSRGAPCPCGSGSKYKKCCMPPEDREVGGGNVFVSLGRRGSAAQMVEFSQPLVDAAGTDYSAIDKAPQLGMICWNLGLVAEGGDDKFIRGHLSTMEKESSRTVGDARKFWAIVVTMFDRYAAMRQAARPRLKRIIEGAWGADLSSPVPILDLPLPKPPPSGADWIEAYRHYLR